MQQLFDQLQGQKDGRIQILSDAAKAKLAELYGIASAAKVASDEATGRFNDAVDNMAIAMDLEGKAVYMPQMGALLVGFGPMEEETDADREKPTPIRPDVAQPGEGEGG